MLDIAVQYATQKRFPNTIKLKRWVKATLKNRIESAELTIRIVEEDEMTQLNSTYRHKSSPTNVLSFSLNEVDDLKNKLPLAGDIVICASVVKEEALTQQKDEEAHWAHMVVHGTLHLLGYDHVKEDEAVVMEGEEIKILNTLGFENPYTQPSRFQHE